MLSILSYILEMFLSPVVIGNRWHVPLLFIVTSIDCYWQINTARMMSQKLQDTCVFDVVSISRITALASKAAIGTGRILSPFCRCVYMLIVTVNSGKTADLIEMPFGMVGLWAIYYMGVQVPHSMSKFGGMGSCNVTYRQHALFWDYFELGLYRIFYSYSIRAE